MNRVYTFHETVRGHLHVLNNISCEDSSASFSAENGKYYIAVVADGHGSQSCFRSHLGSEIAVDVAMDKLKQFAETNLASYVEERFYKDIFSNPRYRHMTIRQLTDTIIAGWHDRVLEDYANNPPTAEEMGESAGEYKQGGNPAHIYGTTLIAALQMPKCLVLIHQGDGRCDVFYTDGSADQPIPWDPRCEDTATTSLCDGDASDRIRSCVINLEQKPVMACFLGCDGVEDAYRDTYEGLGGSHVLMGGVHTFYKDLICRIAEKEQSDFESYLKMMLPDFSANGMFSRSGSGDDVSVAGIVDLDTIKYFIAQYEHDVKLYSLEEELFWKEDELRGKTRKHGILKKRMEEAESSLNGVKLNLKEIEKKRQEITRKRAVFAQEVEQAKDELAGYGVEYGIIIKLGEKFVCFLEQVKKFIGESSNEYDRVTNGYNQMLGKLNKYDSIIEKLNDKHERLQNQISDSTQKFSDAKSAFDEYDAKYRTIEAEIERIKQEIKDLGKGTESNVLPSQ